MHIFMMHATIDGQYELWQTDDKQFNEIIKYWHITQSFYNVHNFKHVHIMQNYDCSLFLSVNWFPLPL